ncbi:uncharacterized protein LOC111029506 [Myzus persicae]|uniref:uncharacterized protein LOC111029506 n=1 Tax=Myzus persicae TaxID=13164 RepID=UPI000B9357BC|nr:uncharacterized protein LOC111029506 [Myzus persicae]
MPKKRKSNLGHFTNSAKRMRLSRNNHSQMHDQNMVDNNDNNHNANAHQQTYLSIDNLTDQDNAIDIPIEFSNFLNPSGLPPHKLDLKIGAPIIHMRNLNAPKLCNGTRLRIVTMQRNVIEAKVLSGSAQGQVVFIPRIPMITNEYPFEFKRVQFPIKLCFAMSVNKAQRQTLNVAGLDITNPCFTRGQFYVACSRVSSAKLLYVYANHQRTKNIVYKEVL